MSGVKGRSGRPKGTGTKSRVNAQISLTKKLPRAIEIIGEVIDGTLNDRLRYEAAVEVKNSVMGKPKQAVDVQSGGEKLGAGLLVELFSFIVETQRELSTRLQIEEGTHGQGLTEGEDTGEGEALHSVTREDES